MAQAIAPKHSIMFAEAQSAPGRVRAQLDANAGLVAKLGAVLRGASPRLVLTCARGSSDHAATFAKYLIETQLRVPVASFAPSLVSVYGAPPRDLRGAVFLAISQSGRSPDLVATTAAARAAGALTIALVNVTESPLAAEAQHVVPLHAGEEVSVAATKSYIASLSALAALVAAWGEDAALAAALDALPGQLERAWGLDWSGAVVPLVAARNLFVVSRGLGLGVAQEAALKLKETCALHAEAFSAAEVEHGPMTIVRDRLPVLVLPPEGPARADSEALAHAFAARGARVLVAGAGEPGMVRLPRIEGVHPALWPVTAVQSFYRLANALAFARGLNPDRPPFLKKVTETQ